MILEKGFPSRMNAANSLLRAGMGMAFESAQRETIPMLTNTACLLFGMVALLLLTGFRDSGRSREAGPEYAGDGQLKFPEHYRDWVYLTSGFDMSYTPATAQAASHHMFDNVFVNPDAYKAFRETGTWPDKTVLVLENRSAKGKGSINQSGNYQSTDVMGVEVHVKDSGRFAGKWAFFGFSDRKEVAKMIPQSAGCYSCHAAHAAVDTTFVQFYPTLLPTAQSKGTLSATDRKEVGSAEK